MSYLKMPSVICKSKSIKIGAQIQNSSSYIFFFLWSKATVGNLIEKCNLIKAVLQTNCMQHFDINRIFMFRSSSNFAATR